MQTLVHGPYMTIHGGSLLQTACSALSNNPMLNVMHSCHNTSLSSASFPSICCAFDLHDSTCMYTIHQKRMEAYRNDFAHRERSVPSLAAAPEAPCVRSIVCERRATSVRQGSAAGTALRQASESHRLLARPAPHTDLQ